MAASVCISDNSLTLAPQCTASNHLHVQYMLVNLVNSPAKISFVGMSGWVAIGLSPRSEGGREGVSE